MDKTTGVEVTPELVRRVFAEEQARQQALTFAAHMRHVRATECVGCSEENVTGKKDGMPWCGGCEI